MKLNEMSRQQLENFYQVTLAEYEKCKAQGLHLDMSRGKPGREQLDLSMDLLNMHIDPNETKMDGVEARNYGELMGLPAARRLFAELLGVRFEQVFAGGSASLTLMYDLIAKAYTHGLLHSEKPWSKLDKVRFLCPAPGYDRHFTISSTFGMELITIPMTDNGPDMDLVEEYVKDPAVKGMWCVPKYSNPDGIVYSDETIDRIASLRPAAPDFTLVWDNAYCVHEFDGDFVPFVNILDACEKAGNPDMVFEFASTSKITFPGAGIACFACSEANMDYMKKLLNAQIISYDKINHLRHVLYFKNAQGVLDHMKKHAAIMKPKFDTVLRYLDGEIAPLDIAHWHRPRGGYFVSLFVMNGCAKRVHALCKEAGVVMTGAGATYPGKNDPNDSNLRIAPSFPPLDELEKAMQVLCVCIKLAAAEKLLNK
ncbi:MAG: aminotransferase class I/II-fold pyridoxal phosphate-dependent enzyme [Clostridia bacterium]|nr:aminotransferase class I/II-fold pyridoxal phosphate-dependent enzyme [Clostridia bacterium]MBQ3939430.1 aminotransferase class I/II-fold pyridoxal phosphate-dependent enzyme [Clostridia bacterium]MBQ5487918.1 aminotransferase class I/II-fold pyridoxal phosphate-dependent enzyme [Clostridia bacterium]